MLPSLVSKSLIAAAVLCAAPAIARAQCSDWTGGFYPAGASDPVYASLVFDDGSGPALYVGGSFTSIGAAAAGGVAKRTAADWSPLGSGVASSFSAAKVWAMEVFDSGSGPELYVGGSFDSAGGVPAVNIAKWNGSSWSALDLGLRRSTSNAAEVRALAVFDDGSGPQLYAGGYFDLAGSTTAYNIARWNGSSWSDVGGGGTSGRVRALEVYDFGTGPRLYVGGDFTKIDGLDKPYLARLSATAWIKVPGVGSPVHCLAVHDDGSGSQLYIGGTTFNGGLTGVARWNGTTLSNLPFLYTPACFTTYDDGLHGPELYAGGSAAWGGPFAKKWNGAAWSDLVAGQFPDGSVRTLCGYDDGNGSRLYLGGEFLTLGNVASNFIVRWDGLNPAWSAIGPSNTVDDEVFALGAFAAGGGAPDLYLGGNFAYASSTPAGYAARWDHTSWFDLAGSMPPAGVVHDYEVWDDGGGADLYCVGNFNVVGGLNVNKIARWDGTTWSQLGNGLPSGNNATVEALAVFDDGNGEALYAGGTFTSAGNRIARWNGTSWSALGSGTNGHVSALATFDDGAGEQLYAGGVFTLAGGQPAAHVARWNGSTWSAVGGGFDGNVRALAVFDDGSGAALYAGGAFTSAGGLPASNIARWNGTTWSALGAGCSGTVLALCVYDDGRGPALYCGGSFTGAGGADASRIARWDGASWEPLGSGLDSDVDALFVHDDGNGAALYVGGAFHTAGGRSSNFLARWSRVCCPPSSYCTAGTTSNGCVPAIGASGTPSASASSGFTIHVVDVEGQKQGHIFYGLSGALANPWSPTSSSYLCVKAPSQRTPTQDSGGTSGLCDGAMQIDWLDYVATHPSSLGAPFSAGTQVWAQLYFRDPAAPKTTNLSDGLTFTVCP